MNNNKLPKSFLELSEQLSEIFDHMDYIKSSFSRIEAYMKKKFYEIEKEINPNNDHDVSRELQHHITNFLHNIYKNYETKNHFFY